MISLQKLKDTDWNNPKEITAKEIAEYLFSLIQKGYEEQNDTIEVKAPEFVIHKHNKCSKERLHTINLEIQKLNNKNVKNKTKQIQYELNEGYSPLLFENDDKHMENSTVKGLRAAFKYNDISEEHINCFLPPASDITNWNKKIQITKIEEARIVARHLRMAQSKKDFFQKLRLGIAKQTSQQKRNQTQYKTITDWNAEVKDVIFQELIAIKTSKVKAQRIASKCVSVIKKIIS
ncbi:MAG: hypothetical protein EOM50_13995 [Erysipelotrichia bacterium]|nr:hypothetical protein [Erysipelotrichia bacterium]